MSQRIEFESGLARNAAMDKVRHLVGADKTSVSAHFSGRVSEDKFRLYHFGSLSHPLKPVVVGRAEDIGAGCRVEVQEVSPWLGHAAMLVLALVIGVQEWPSHTARSIAVLVVAAIWASLMFERKRELRYLFSVLQRELA